ncbi:hypothetical protein HETIRDRAFT_103543 [Heterobasidion irregulare TC 32-1]|uniref:Uncharacterized protein n=1 Tax=Heterobasidion irregulare (strain TC 32-1) TaxID=747525 RepID=W4K3H1_HETIT|nr:uncharacterized protein HETIRDRAFT_103543 [Heterobasidion irregulare TC 32-1]ETW79880.1 hypothetical protein HETIRDRAFT_103543 [Heterobasidion irregulare TC 32-1]
MSNRSEEAEKRSGRMDGRAAAGGGREDRQPIVAFPHQNGFGLAEQPAGTERSWKGGTARPRRHGRNWTRAKGADACGEDEMVRVDERRKLPVNRWARTQIEGYSRPAPIIVILRWCDARVTAVDNEVPFTDVAQLAGRSRWRGRGGSRCRRRVIDEAHGHALALNTGRSSKLQAQTRGFRSCATRPTPPQPISGLARVALGAGSETWRSPSDPQVRLDVVFAMTISSASPLIARQKAHTDCDSPRGLAPPQGFAKEPAGQQIEPSSQSRIEISSKWDFVPDRAPAAVGEDTHPCARPACPAVVFERPTLKVKSDLGPTQRDVSSKDIVFDAFCTVWAQGRHGRVGHVIVATRFHTLDIRGALQTPSAARSFEPMESERTDAKRAQREGEKTGIPRAMMMITPSRVSFIKQRALRLAAKPGARDGCRERVLESEGILTLHSAPEQRHSQVDQDAGGRARRHPTPICRCARDSRRREVSAGFACSAARLLGLAFSEPSWVLPRLRVSEPAHQLPAQRERVGFFIFCGPSSCLGGHQAAWQTSFSPMAIPINL